jgi:hypothetical protein
VPAPTLPAPPAQAEQPALATESGPARSARTESALAAARRAQRLPGRDPRPGTPHPSAPPVEEPPVVDVPLARWPADAVRVFGRAVDADRDTVRRTMGPSFDDHVGTVHRVLAEHPGLRTLDDEHVAMTIGDLVAVRTYMADAARIDQALRTGRADGVGPVARCVLSGMLRLPSARGPVVHGGAGGPAADRYRPGMIVADPAFLNAAGNARVDDRGGARLVIWSLSGRRVADIGSAEDARVGRVLFAPGTRFAVLDVVDSNVLLVERTGPRSSELDRVVLARLGEYAATLDEPGDPRPLLAPEAHAWAFGGLRHWVDEPAISETADAGPGQPHPAVPAPAGSGIGKAS